MTSILPTYSGWGALFITYLTNIIVPLLFRARLSGGFDRPIGSETWIIAITLTVICLGTIGFAALRGGIGNKVAATISIVLLLMFAVNLSHYLKSHPAPASVDETIVATLDNSLPSKEGERRMFLWENFANKPAEQKFGSYKVKDWKTNYTNFTYSLTRKAETQKLDSGSLSKALDLILQDASKDSLAYLPVGAYQTTLDSKPIWIITVKWEYLLIEDKGRLSHIRVFAFDQKTLEQVGFSTCK